MFIEDGSLSGISDVMDDYENEMEESHQKSTIAEKSVRLPQKLTIAEKIIRSRQPSSTYRTDEAVAPTTS